MVESSAEPDRPPQESAAVASQAPGSKRDARWRAVAGRLPAIYACSLLVLAFLALVGTYQPADNDLWYHLAHGRFIWENGSVPTTTYFSFQTPEREWVDYYWLFEVIVYSAWRFGGPALVVALRAVACLGFLVLLWRFLAAGGRAARSPWWISLLLGMATCAVWFRLTTFRPHTFSYLALLGFVVLFEGPLRRRWWLIPLTVLWMNLHGVYYPVVLLVVAAYGSEWLVRRIRGSGRPSGLLSMPLCSLGVLLAILLTPHGSELGGVPFISTEQASRSIEELGRLPWASLWTYELRQFIPVGHTASMLLLLLTSVGVAALAWRRRLRIAHLVLVLGGLALLWRAGRFATELSILALPMLRDLGPLVGLEPLWRRGRPAAVLLALLALVPACARVGRDIDLRSGRGPIWQSHAPRGPAGFIRRLGVAGRVMNWPDDGGYLIWALPRGNPIFMDMEIPFLFRDEDWIEITSAYATEHGLEAFLERHRPAFVVALLHMEPLGRWLARDHADYRPVYFDDRRVVWADRRQLPAQVERWELEVADPFGLRDASFQDLDPERRTRLRGELEDLAEIAGGSALVSGSLARLDLIEGDRPAVIDRVSAAVQGFPEDAWLAEVEAAAWSASGDHAAAVEAIERSLSLTKEPDARSHRQYLLARELGALGRWEEAYLAAAELVGRLGSRVPPELVLDLAEAALLADRAGDARKILAHAEIILPAADPRRARLDALRAKLRSE